MSCIGAKTYIVTFLTGIKRVLESGARKWDRKVDKKVEKKVGVMTSPRRGNGEVTITTVMSLL